MLLLIYSLSLTSILSADDTSPELSEQAVLLLNQKCVNCHGPEKSEGNLRLDTRAALLKGGDRGPGFTTSNAEKSLLLRSVNGTEDGLEMPPKLPLSKLEIGLLERWIKAGAQWPMPLSPSATTDRIGPASTDPRNPIVKLFGGKRLDLWSLKPVIRPQIPAVEPSDWPRNDIDRFVLKQFNQAKRVPQASADRRTLIRRLSFDLIGLPPEATQVAAFETKADESCVEALVEQLLDSPRFGEHWARLWLDVVRYSDSNGFDWDEFRPSAYRFRDYVIRSLNADKPYDQFIREQLAGDELLAGVPQSPADQDLLLATGFLRLGPHDNAAGLFNEQDRGRHEWLTDLTETTGNAFLGLTLSCCRCHDHKYDPLSHADYYRLRACFAAVNFADDVALELGPEQDAINAGNQKLDLKIAELQQKRDAIDAVVRKRLKNDKAEPQEIDKALTEAERKTRTELQSRIDSTAGQKQSLTHALLVTDAALQPTHVLYQGSHKSPRDTVEPGIPSIFDPQPIALEKSLRESSSGRRLTLAQWIASPANPWTARVMVNRVWQALMGHGLVRTPGDFGLAGLPPDNPELLDWLASEFIEHNWSIKQLIRRIVLSATYQQQSTYDRSPETLVYAIRQPRRLTAEQLRDSMLCVSGLLTNKSEGPVVWPDLPREVLEANPAFLDDNALKIKGWYPSPEAEQYCRSIFLVQKRNTRIPILESFDLPDNSVTCARRGVSIVAPQAISMLNGNLSIKSASAFARRLEEQSSEHPGESQIQRAFRLAFQRQATQDEQQVSAPLLEMRGLTEFCRVLLNLTEFAYID